MIELKDTIDGMTSEDYRKRFVAEYQQTKIRYEKLKAFCNRIEAAKRMNRPEPTHDCPINILWDQCEAMEGYLATLEMRASIEDIELTY